MSTQVQYRRGTAAQNDAFTGALAEITVDTTNLTLRVHDGINAGGSNIATVAYVDNAIGSLSANAIVNGTTTVDIGAADANVTVSVDGTSNVVVFSSAAVEVAGNVLPAANITYDLGSASQRWRDLYLDGNSIFLGNAQISANVDSIILTNPDGGQTVLSGVTPEISASTITATGNISGGNLSISGQASVTGNISGGNVSGATGAFTTVTGNGRALTSLNATNLDTGTVSSSTISGSYTGITGVGTLSVGTWQANSISTTYTDAKVTSVNASTGISVNATTGAVTVTNTGVTSAVAGTGVSVSGATGAVTFSIGQAVGTGDSPTFAGLTIPAITKNGSNGVGNIGQSNNTFNTVFARATSALYADLAELYTADTKYAPGTILVFGGSAEVTESTQSHCTKIAGVVSTEPAHIMNSALTAEHVAAVALVGRVPCRVVGQIQPGDCLVSSDIPGVATAMDAVKYQPGAVIGKALENYNSIEPGVIEAVVGRL